MKKIVLASAAMGGAALVAFGASGTFAAFSDQGQTSSEVGAGTFLLGANSPSATTPSEAVDLVPGEQAQYAYFFQNNSSTIGRLSAVYSVSSSTENGCYQPELKAGDNCAASNDGDLGAFATVVGHYVKGLSSAAACNISLATPANRVSDGNNQPYAASPLDVAASNTDGYTLDTLAPGAGLCVILDIALPDATNVNRVQSDRLTYSATVTLTQVIP